MCDCDNCDLKHRCTYVTNEQNYACPISGPYDLYEPTIDKGINEDKRNRVVELETTSQIKN